MLVFESLCNNVHRTKTPRWLGPWRSSSSEQKTQKTRNIAAAAEVHAFDLHDQNTKQKPEILQQQQLMQYSMMGSGVWSSDQLLCYNLREGRRLVAELLIFLPLGFQSNMWKSVLTQPPASTLQGDCAAVIILRCFFSDAVLGSWPFCGNVNSFMLLVIIMYKTASFLWSPPLNIIAQYSLLPRACFLSIPTTTWASFFFLQLENRLNPELAS